MKVAQLMATIPDLLPPEYAAELPSCRATPRRWAGPSSSGAWTRNWAPIGRRNSQPSSTIRPPLLRSARCIVPARSTARRSACKLQYPDMQSAVEADLQQLAWLLAIRRRLDTAIDTSEIGKEIGARVREELDYRREAKHVALYRRMLDGIDIVRVPRAWPELSTGRLLTLDWLEGTRMLAHKNDPLAVRNALATAMFTAWWFPFSRFGVIHGDPHLGNYTVFERAEAARARIVEPAGINLLDYGCIRIFPPKFVRGVVDLYHGLLHDDDELVVRAYETWGFRRLSRESDRHAQHLGAVHLRAAARRPRAHHRRRRRAGRIRAPRGLPGAPAR